MAEYYDYFMRTFKGDKKLILCGVCGNDFDSLKELKEHKSKDHSY